MEAARCATGTDRIASGNKGGGASTSRVNRAGGECGRRPGGARADWQFVSACRGLRTCAERISHRAEIGPAQSGSDGGRGRSRIQIGALPSGSALSADGARGQSKRPTEHGAAEDYRTGATHGPVPKTDHEGGAECSSGTGV